MRHLMSPLDFSVEELDELLKLAQDIEAHPDKYAHACDGKKLATLFYEPSTRTRLSHEAAMLNLGGSVMGFSSASSSSASKGERVSDTIRTISCYADWDGYFIGNSSEISKVHINKEGSVRYCLLEEYFFGKKLEI